MKDLDLNNNSSTKPFLRWAGGKTWLINHFDKIKGLKFNNYHETFLGGGSTFFHLTPVNHSYLSDLNNELIETYQAVKTDVSGVIEKLQQFKNDEDSYYQIRETSFKDQLDRAARFIYLNQTSFNGIYRVNLKGKYNVPYGFRKKNFIDVNALKLASQALKKTTIFEGDFFDTLSNINERDLVFLDPPYTVSHNDNGFIKYNEKIFSIDDQIRLSLMIDQIKEKNAFYILTNAAHFKIEEIFEKGDKKIKLQRATVIGGAKADRGQTNELVFTNIDL